MSAVDLEALQADGLRAYAEAQTLDALDAAKNFYVGRRGALTSVQRSLGSLPENERRDLGARVNAARAALAQAESQRRHVLEEERDRVVLAAEAVDVTLPPRVPKLGSLHPVQETMEAMVDVFVGLGYRVATGPEVESDWFNFEALNYQPDHPARSLMDTIYVRAPGAEADQQGVTDLLLRTHTSPVQARTMLAQPPPVYIVAPGRVYRADIADATHLPAFHQIEGLAIDTDLTMADLRGTLVELVHALLGDVPMRFRPHHFPFTEPSAELDIWLDGRWVELLGCGMVHPNVLRACGYDPEEVQGFAFGIGPERLAMRRHGISDMRLFVESDLRFLSAFPA
ncbi:MAG: phenylalanine--tRNA ligase subunit alpha [Nitriliruptorales bacterium]|nr:phenylalanine--tRNA ligase subunit alpha [Nitriliruptorales bacterium]